MNDTSDRKLINRWMPRLDDQSDDVQTTAYESLSLIAIRNPQLRNMIVPKILQAAKMSDSSMPLNNGFLMHAAEIAEVDPTWAEEFFDVHSSIVYKNMEYASGFACEKMLLLLKKGSIAPNNPAVAEANEFCSRELANNGNPYSRNAFFAFIDWCEDHGVASPAEEAFPDETTESLPWPTTEAPCGGGSFDSSVFQLEVGILKAIGYTVGATRGLGVDARRKLLRDFYTSSPPLPTDHPQYDEWASPKSSSRLLKLANTIAAHVRNAKRRRQRPEIAISEWESDLAFLKGAFFEGTFTFCWPSTTSFQLSGA